MHARAWRDQRAPAHRRRRLASREAQRLHDLLEEVLAHELRDLAHHLVEARAWSGLELGSGFGFGSDQVWVGVRVGLRGGLKNQDQASS